MDKRLLPEPPFPVLAIPTLDFVNYPDLIRPYVEAQIERQVRYENQMALLLWGVHF